jgi:hypothetical protein
LGDCRETYLSLVILKRLHIALKDPDAPSEPSRTVGEIAKSLVLRTSSKATATREVKTAQNVVELAWIGLFVDLLGRFSTGSSLSAFRSTVLTVLTTPYHFVPHLSCKLLIVKRKLKGRTTRLDMTLQTTTACG